MRLSPFRLTRSRPAVFAFFVLCVAIGAEKHPLDAQMADNRVVAARFEHVSAAPRLVVQDDGARYPLTIDPVAQQVYLKASNTSAGDLFGSVVAVSGDTLVVGASNEDSNAIGIGGNQTNESAAQAGAVYVFTRSAGVWRQQAYLKASNTSAGDLFGYSVAVWGDTVVVGAPGEDSSIAGNQTDNSAADAGAAYVFTRSAGVWSQQAYLKASNTGASDLFGYSVALSGDTAVVGARGEASSAIGVDGNQANNTLSQAGAAYVFKRSAGIWSQQAYLKASNTGGNDLFGYSVAVSGDTAVVGARGEASNAMGVGGNELNDAAPEAGAAYVFVRIGSVWSQQAYLKASNTDAADLFGNSVGISVDTIVVGAQGEASNAIGVGGDQADDTAPQAGAVYAFTRSSGVWSQQAYLKASNTDANDLFGISVAVSGNTVVVGAYGESSFATGVDGNQVDDSALQAGAAYVFRRTADVWGQHAYLKASNTGAGDLFGCSVAASGGTVAIGAYGEASFAKGVGGDQLDDTAAQAGAVYAFIGIPAALPTIVNVNPNSGPIGGGQLVTIDGTNLRAASVTIGGNGGDVTSTTPSTATLTTPSHTAGAFDVTVTTDAGSATSIGGYTYIIPVPVSTATANATSVTVSWSSVSGAASYDVVRSADGTTFTPVDSTSETSLTDSGAAANTAYLYKVRALDSANNAGPYSGADLATMVIFTDDPLVNGTIIQKVHIVDLRTAVNAVRRLAGLGEGSFTDPTITVGVTVIRAVHLTDLRTNLDEARIALELPSPSYMDGTITAFATVIKAAHVAELRNRIK